MKIRACLIAGTAVAALYANACAADEIGKSDYAKVYLDKNNSCVPFVRKYESVCGANFPGDKNGVDEKNGSNTSPFDIRAREDHCSGKDVVANHAEVRPGEIMSVSLQSAFIKDFSTLPWQDEGGIAIVARVAEQDRGADFNWKDGFQNGRLVYYSDGVVRGQYLNLSQLPIYGPIEYTGKPVFVELYIMQIAIEKNSDLRGMLAAVSNLGKIAYPPASPVLSVLEQIGSGLLATKKTETVFKYQFVLRPGEGRVPVLRSALVEYGNYVFVRDPKENAGSQNWSGWYFNQKNGRLYTEKTCSDLAVERTYLSIQINRSSVAASLDDANTIQKLMTSLEADANASASKKEAIVSGLAKTIQANGKYKDAKELIENASVIRYRNGKDNPVAVPKIIYNRISDLADAVAKTLANPAAVVPPDLDENNAKNLAGLLNALSGKDEITSSLAFDAQVIKDKLATPTPY